MPKPPKFPKPPVLPGEGDAQLNPVQASLDIKRRLGYKPQTQMKKGGRVRDMFKEQYD